MHEFSVGNKVLFKSEIWEVQKTGNRSIKIKRFADRDFKIINSYALKTIYQRDFGSVSKVDKLLIHKIITDAKTLVTNLLQYVPKEELKK